VQLQDEKYWYTVEPVLLELTCTKGLRLERLDLILFHTPRLSPTRFSALGVTHLEVACCEGRSYDPPLTLDYVIQLVCAFDQLESVILLFKKPSGIFSRDAINTNLSVPKNLRHFSLRIQNYKAYQDILRTEADVVGAQLFHWLLSKEPTSLSSLELFFILSPTDITALLEYLAKPINGLQHLGISPLSKASDSECEQSFPELAHRKSN
jgi:hypothetical protein